MRATAARIAVLVTLHEQRGPMTHEQVMETLPEGGFDLNLAGLGGHENISIT